MDVWQLLGTLRRWWYVCWPAGALAVVLALHVLNPAPTYATAAQVLLRPAEIPGQNYLTRLGPDLIGSSTLIARALAADGYGGRLGVSTDRASYQVNLEEPGATLQKTGQTIGPVLAINVRSTDPVAASQLLDQLLNEVTQQLETRQGAAGVPPVLRVEAAVLARTNEPAVLPLSRKRAIVGMGGLAVLLTLGAASLLASVDSEHAGRSLRRAAARSAASTRRVGAVTLGGRRTRRRPLHAR